MRIVGIEQKTGGTGTMVKDDAGFVRNKGGLMWSANVPAIGTVIVWVFIAPAICAPLGALAANLTCLTGTDPSVTDDLNQIAVARAAIESACACASFDGPRRGRRTVPTSLVPRPRLRPKSQQGYCASSARAR